MNPFQKLEQAIGGLFRKLGPGNRPPEPLEIRRALLREIAAQVQPKGGGEYFFPHTSVQIDVFTPDGLQQQVLDAMFEGPGFAEEIAAELARSGCPGSRPQVQVWVLQDPAAAAGPAPYKIQYSRHEAAASDTAKPRPPARLVVVRGQAAVTDLVIDRDVIYIGRIQEVLNSRTGLDRYNHLAFDATELTVSRKHAVVKYDAASGKFRVFNDPESQAGITVFRDGRILTCDSTRGVQLRTGDELLLGTARVRFELL